MRGIIGSRSQLIRAFYGGLGKTAVIYPAAFAVAVAIGQLQLGLVLYARFRFTVSRSQIGLLAGIWALTYVVGCLFLRPRFNRIRPRYLIMSSTATMAILTLAMPWVESFSALLWLYALFGFMLGLFWPPMMGWLSTESEGVQLSKVIARFNVAWCSGNVVSPFLCGWLSERHPRQPLLLASALLLLVFVFVLGASLALPKVKGDVGVGAPSDHSPGGRDHSCELRFAAWLGLFASFFALGVVVAVFPLAGLAEWGMAETTIGALLMLRGLTNAAGFVLLGRGRWWHFRRWPMLAGQWLIVAVFLGLALSSSSLGFGLLLALLGIGGAMSYTASIFHGAIGSLHRTRRMAIHESVLAGGLLLGSLSGGWLYQSLSPAWVFSTVAGVVAGLAVVQTGLSKRADTIIFPAMNSSTR